MKNPSKFKQRKWRSIGFFKK